MATVTNSTRTTVRPFRHRFGTFDIRPFPVSTIVGSSAKIVYGDVVQFDVNVASANFRIVKASSGMSTAGPNVLSTAKIGVAVEADAGLTSSLVYGQQVIVACGDKDSEFVFPTKLAGAAHASSLVGLRGTLDYDSTAKFFYADAASTAGDGALVFTGLYDTEGTTNGRVVAKFLSTGMSRLISGAF